MRSVLKLKVETNYEEHKKSIASLVLSRLLLWLFKRLLKVILP